MSNTTNRQKYLDFIEQREVYGKKATDRFRELFLTILPIMLPFDDYDNEVRKRFPNAVNYSVTSLPSLIDQTKAS